MNKNVNHWLWLLIWGLPCAAILGLAVWGFSSYIWTHPLRFFGFIALCLVLRAIVNSAH